MRRSLSTDTLLDIARNHPEVAMLAVEVSQLERKLRAIMRGVTTHHADNGRSNNYTRSPTPHNESSSSMDTA